MQTFEQALDLETWVEVLDGGSELYFDASSSRDVSLHFSESGTPPASDAVSVPVKTWPSSWDFSTSGLRSGTQRIWARGNGKIVGIRR